MRRNKMRNSLRFQTRRTLLALGIATAVIVPGAASHAAPIAFVANLLPGNEVPPTASTGSGTAIVIIDPSAHTMHINAVFSGLTSNTTAAHIHCCEATPGANLNVGVATVAPAF